MKLNKNIKRKETRNHSKASEKYIDVKFTYDESIWEGSVPIEYRRTGTFARDEEEVIKILNETYELLNPKNYQKWLENEEKFWSKTNKEITKPFFDATKDGKWKCRNCDLPQNPNWARRWQDIKEMGYTTATNTKMYCENWEKNTTHILLLPIPRKTPLGYESFNKNLRKKILKTLEKYDVYEERKNEYALPDHKFSEIRWDKDTPEENPKDMSEEEIKAKFQLLTNQRNQQKREVCRKCYQTNKRGYPYGIKFYYKGTEEWGENIPKIGKKAEKGCIGCGWYDIAKWKKELHKQI